MRLETLRQWRLMPVAMGVILLASSAPATAQTLILDGTTPTLLNGGSASCSGDCTITGGIQSGVNLFHSFTRFGADRGATVTFSDPGVQNILTRVTGSDRSLINGTLSVTGGNANLFLLNPNGISFGDNASLQLNGSFVASSAEAIAFQDGSFGITDSSAASSVLTVNVPTGLQLGSNSRDIAVQGTGNNLFLSQNRAINRPLLVPDLQLGDQTLALVGGAINVDGAVLSAAGGRIALGSVTEGIVGLSPANQGLRLNYDNAAALGNITLDNAALIDVSGPSAGEVQLQGNVISLDNGSAVLAGTLGSGQGGSVDIQAEQLLLSGAASFSPSFIPPQFAQFVVMPSGIFASVEPGASGSGSEINLNAREINLSDGAQVAAATFGAGDAGSLNITTETVTATGGRVGGPTGLFTTVAAGPDGGPMGAATGAGGNLSITTDRLSAQGGAQLSASTFGFGNAGNLTVNSQSIEVLGSFSFQGRGGPSSIRSASERPWAANGGKLMLATDSLLVAEGGQVVTGTLSNGDAGEITVRANQVNLRGSDDFGQSGLLSSAIGFSPAGGNGRGGNIVVEAKEVSITDGAVITVSNLPSSANPRLVPGQGPVGNVTIAADELNVSDSGKITTASTGGEDGNITIDVPIINLRRNARITADATGSATGGNIAIATNFLIAPAQENSDITANAENNFGGNIQINSQRLFGISPRDQLTLESDITASSALGVNAAGEVVVNDLAVNPTQGIIALPQMVAIDNQIQAACAPEDTGIASTFTRSGRGNLPPAPGDYIQPTSLWQDSLTASSFSEASAAEPEVIAQVRASQRNSAVVESQAWSYNSNGQVQLLGLASARSSSSPLVLETDQSSSCLK